MKADPGSRKEPAGARSIFVLGLMRRTGTNFLYDLLLQHPDCRRVRAPIWEDFTLAHTEHLGRYVRAVSREWDPAWGYGEAELTSLRSALGEAVCGWLHGAEGDGIVVAKTPSLVNLPAFFDYFPRSKLVILVRDGRSVVESGMRSFGWDREEATRLFADSAQVLLDFQARHADRLGRDFFVLRYEDLVEDPAAALTPTLRGLGLDPARYPRGAARRVPVRGSSSLGRNGGKVHWEPVARAEAFKPVARFEHWTAGEHARFDHLAGEQLRALGYAPRGPGGPGRWNRLRDLVDQRWRLRRLARRLVGRQL